MIATFADYFWVPFGRRWLDRQKKAFFENILIFLIIRLKFRWSQYILRSAQHIRPHRDVCVLLPGRSRTPHDQIPLVEEIPDQSATGKS